jgi:hypothetical protein
VLLDGGEDVEDSAAHSELATTLDNVSANVATLDKLFNRLRDVNLVTDVQPNRLNVTEPYGEWLKQSTDRRDKN